MYYCYSESAGRGAAGVSSSSSNAARHVTPSKALASRSHQLMDTSEILSPVKEIGSDLFSPLTNLSSNLGAHSSKASVVTTSFVTPCGRAPPSLSAASLAKVGFCEADPATPDSEYDDAILSPLKLNVPDMFTTPQLVVQKKRMNHFLCVKCNVNY